MTTPSPVEEQFGNCDRILNPKHQFIREGEEEICNKPGVTEILVRNQFGRFVVTLCNDCRTEHYKFYQETRRSRRERRDGAAQTRGRDKSDSASLQA